MKLRILAIFCLSMLSSCSIKEARDDCPCNVTLNIDAFASLDGNPKANMLTVGGTVTDMDELYPSEFLGKGYSKIVKRVPNVFSMTVGHDGLVLVSDSLTVAYGREWGKVLTGSVVCHCGHDREYVSLSPGKEYCNVSFVMAGGETPFPYECRVRASCFGVRVSDRYSLEGPYSAVARHLDPGNVSEVRMPRQNDYSCVLELMEGDKTVETIDMGRMMKDEGYDWTKPDLDDLMVIIDWASPAVTVEIIGWGEETIKETI